MSNDDNNSTISSVEYKKITEELYNRNLELARLYKQVESLNHDLENANKNLKELIKQRESLVHLITHKVKGSFTRTKYIFAEMLNNSFGQLTPELKNMATRGLETDEVGIKTIDLVLNASNLQNGIVKYDMKPFDFRDLVSSAISEKKALAQNKNLVIEENLFKEECRILGDIFWLKEVILNLLDNSIKYTKQGKITVTINKNQDKILLSVKDTGVGINEEDMKNLFTEGGRGKDSIKMNVDSTGYGLYSVRLIVEAHGGKVWAESAGTDLGSEFFVEFHTV